MSKFDLPSKFIPLPRDGSRNEPPNRQRDWAIVTYDGREYLMSAEELGETLIAGYSVVVLHAFPREKASA